MATAAVLIIGDEILSGKFPDENGPHLIRRLRELGVDLVHLAVLTDDVAVIAEEVARASARCDHVFTTGGVGPTHDDLTFEGVARAFDQDLVVHPELAGLLDRHRMERTPSNLRMATVPAETELVWTEGFGFPTVRVGNVWVLPGVPPLMRQKFELVAPRFADEAVRCVRVFARDLETDVAQALGGVQARHDRVGIGSYPRFGASDHRLIVTLESRDEAALDAAVDAVVDVLDVVRVEREGARGD